MPNIVIFSAVFKKVLFAFYTVSFANQVFPFAYLSKQLSFSVEKNMAEFESRITWYNV